MSSGRGHGRGSPPPPPRAPGRGPGRGPGGPLWVQEGPEQGNAGPAEFGEIEPDRGECGREELCLWRVVEADDADASRDRPAGLVHGPDHADREVVVTAQHRGDLRVGSENAARLVTGAGIPSGLRRFRYGHCALMEGRPPAGRPLTVIG